MLRQIFIQIVAWMVILSAIRFSDVEASFRYKATVQSLGK